MHMHAAQYAVNLVEDFSLAALFVGCEHFGLEQYHAYLDSQHRYCLRHRGEASLLHSLQACTCTVLMPVNTFVSQ